VTILTADGSGGYGIGSPFSGTDTASADQFGNLVTISSDGASPTNMHEIKLSQSKLRGTGSYLAVGAPNAPGSGSKTGELYVFTGVSGIYTQSQIVLPRKLTGSLMAFAHLQPAAEVNSENFALSIALSTDAASLIVGCLSSNSKKSGRFEVQRSEMVIADHGNAGNVYYMTRPGSATAFGFDATLSDPNSSQSSLYGVPVAIVCQANDALLPAMTVHPISLQGGTGTAAVEAVGAQGVAISTNNAVGVSSSHSLLV
jgi:hypothetical protein